MSKIEDISLVQIRKDSLQKSKNQKSESEWKFVLSPALILKNSKKITKVESRNGHDNANLNGSNIVTVPFVSFKYFKFFCSKRSFR